LHDTGRGQVVQVHQHPRRQAVEVANPVRLVGQHAGQAQRLVADLDAVADLQVKCCKQPRLGPGFAGCRSAAGLLGFIGLRSAAQGAPQRITAAGGLDAGKLQILIGRDDAGELEDLGMREALRRARFDLRWRRRRAAAQHQVSTEELAGA